MVFGAVLFFKFFPFCYFKVFEDELKQQKTQAVETQNNENQI